MNFYPRSPCGERLWVLRKVPILGIFLSTLSLRRATRANSLPHAPPQISIHALLAESDGIGLVFLWWGVRFLSTLSLRRATGSKRQTYHRYEFLSTLSLRRATGRSWRKQSNHHKFLSTLSLRRATVHYDNYNLHCVISIHALLAESDTQGVFNLFSNPDFYPRSPCGERRVTVLGIQHRVGISIHALLAESDETQKPKPTR